MSQTFHVPQSKADADPRRWVALFVLLLASFMNLIDVTIVYPDGVPSFWDFLCGRTTRIVRRACAKLGDDSLALGQCALLGRGYLRAFFADLRAQRGDANRHERGIRGEHLQRLARLKRFCIGISRREDQLAVKAGGEKFLPFRRG